MGHLKTIEDQERVTIEVMICQKIPKTAAKLHCSQLAARLALKNESTQWWNIQAQIRSKFYVIVTIETPTPA